MKNKKFLGSIALISMLLAGCGPTAPADTTSSTPISSSTADTPDSSSTEVPVEDDEEIVPITTDYTEKSVNRLVALLNAMEDNDYPSIPESDEVLTMLSILQKSGFTQEALNQLLNVVDKVVSIVANVQVGLDIENTLNEALTGLKEFLALTNGNQLFHIVHYTLDKLFSINISLPEIGRFESIDSINNLMKYLTEAEKATISAFKGYFDFLDTYNEDPTEEEIKNLGDLFYAFLTEALNTITAEDIMSLLGELDPANIAKFVKKCSTVFTNLATNKATILTKAFNSLRGWVNYFVHNFLMTQHTSENFAHFSNIPLGYCVEQHQDIMTYVDTILEKLGEDFLVNLNYYVGKLCANMSAQLIGSLMEYIEPFMGFFAPIPDDFEDRPIMKAKLTDDDMPGVMPEAPIIDPAMFIPSTDIIEWLKTSFTALPTTVQTSFNNTVKAFTNQTLVNILDKTAEFATKDLTVAANQKAMMDYYMGLYEYSLQQFAFQAKLYPVINKYYMEDNIIEVFLNTPITEDMVKSALKFDNYDGEYTLSVDVSKAKTDKLGFFPLDVTVTGILTEPKEMIWINKANEPSDGEGEEETQAEPTTYTYRMYYAVISDTYTNLNFSVHKKAISADTIDLEPSEDDDDGIYMDRYNGILYLPKEENPVTYIFNLYGDMYNSDKTQLEWVTTSAEKTLDVSKVGTYATLLQGECDSGKYVIPVKYRVYDLAKIEKSFNLITENIAIVETEYSKVELEFISKIKMKDFNFEFIYDTVSEITSFDEPLSAGRHLETITYNNTEYQYQLLVVPVSDAYISNTYASCNTINVNDPISALNMKVSCSASIKTDSPYFMIMRDEHFYRNNSTYVNGIDPCFYTVTGFDSSTAGQKQLTITIGDYSFNTYYYVREAL